MADSMEPCKMLRIDRCCHGNEIWARRGDPVAYRLVSIFVFLAVAGVVATLRCHVTLNNNNTNNNNTLIYIAPACRMTSEAQSEVFAELFDSVFTGVL